MASWILGLALKSASYKINNVVENIQLQTHSTSFIYNIEPFYQIIVMFSFTC